MGGLLRTHGVKTGGIMVMLWSAIIIIVGSPNGWISSWWNLEPIPTMHHKKPPTQQQIQRQKITPQTQQPKTTPQIKLQRITQLIRPTTQQLTIIQQILLIILPIKIQILITLIQITPTQQTQQITLIIPIQQLTQPRIQTIPIRIQQTIPLITLIILQTLK